MNGSLRCFRGRQEPQNQGPGCREDHEYFEYNIQGCLTSHVTIYDRWGNKVFENKAQENGPSDPDALDCDNPRNAWDGSYPNGTMASVGSYAYTIEVNYFDGSSETLKGTITLVR